MIPPLVRCGKAAELVLRHFQVSLPAQGQQSKRLKLPLVIGSVGTAGIEEARIPLLAADKFPGGAGVRKDPEPFLPVRPHTRRYFRPL